MASRPATRPERAELLGDVEAIQGDVAGPESEQGVARGKQP